jgi:hypothetical protein
MIEAGQSIRNSYLALAAADKAGGNVTGLLSVLQDAGLLLSKADSAFKKGDYDSAYDLANQGKARLGGFIAEADSLKDTAENSRYLDFMINMVGSSAGTVGIVVGGFAVWFWLKKKYGEVRREKPHEP